MNTLSLPTAVPYLRNPMVQYIPCIKVPVHVPAMDHPLKPHPVFLELRNSPEGSTMKFLKMVPCVPPKMESLERPVVLDPFDATLLAYHLGVQRNTLFGFEFDRFSQPTLQFMSGKVTSLANIHYHESPVSAQHKENELLGPLDVEIRNFFRAEREGTSPNGAKQSLCFTYADLDTLVPKKVFADLKAHLQANGMKFFDSDQNGRIDCSKVQHGVLPAIQISIKGDPKTYHFESKDYIVEEKNTKCRIAIRENPDKDNVDNWIIGALFAKSHATVFKLSQEHRLQFGFWSISERQGYIPVDQVLEKLNENS
uniref:AlNc14C161G7782 protein n=1 Tax=Albugo laibachii Nc14 TaxID=890382 RepID=F0WMU6_9STRA|nr:AlNc14C161G7782 [Albugo laibachii Nc14]|eukprot:CCA22631.1 AlNc14C161G7782 [Albugo laibachii Nc14]